MSDDLAQRRFDAAARLARCPGYGGLVVIACRKSAGVGDAAVRAPDLHRNVGVADCADGEEPDLRNRLEPCDVDHDGRRAIAHAYAACSKLLRDGILHEVGDRALSRN